MATIELKQVNKSYDNQVSAVEDFSLTIGEKEFLVLVGPSGCGKSTTLRMIAGLETITRGDLYIDGEAVTHRPAKERDIAMVFQNYALYPHMSAYENMVFGLKMKKVPREEIQRRVKEAAVILDLDDLLQRKPKELSGGQRQRVALGRAIVREPKAFLMDEPLSNLDAKLRVQMRTELSKLHQRLQTIFVYVTHDQVEAMTMADRIVIMKDGRIQQIGTPAEVYETPANVFVGGFIGSPPMNFMKGQVVREGDALQLICAGEKWQAAGSTATRLAESGLQQVMVGIRPENMQLAETAADNVTDSGHQRLPFQVEVVEYLGANMLVHGTVGDHRLVVSLNHRQGVKAGECRHLLVNMNQIHFFHPETELRL
ncbi:ABC transporter ATP-binding protein [Anoxynatronum buryatiense]|uniref:Carbohydrate ABC transporter ATP-binding protein, CUT1 family n=1 Tax=Anoxynatronum buryatiense TaxID=489973 RepID=A0AA45WXF7_9CLOT|nr:sn-glycerol-3-phosphate ABC transporter ATP-binding protein UgpC [Anoxynatronum buryatiense]SMP58784.1 carbohydrate ABC transporter ATP-binding protein, CUT1 family [Anoxynatronum buryatiense]